MAHREDFNPKQDAKERKEKLLMYQELDANFNQLMDLKGKLESHRQMDPGRNALRRFCNTNCEINKSPVDMKR